MAKVFVSYSRKDLEFAKRLTAELQKSELDFWIDWEGIPPTVDWWREIEKGIEEADVFLFLISPDSAKSKICRQEIDTAVKNGKRIIPIVVREIEWQDTPSQLGHLNYIFFSRDDDFDTAVKKLMTAIQADYEWAATHRRLQVKALDWERNGKEMGYLLRGADLQDAEQDLATNTSKDPHPTDLQREYVFESRKATDRQKRITTGISIVGAIILAALAVFGFVQASRATKAQAAAEAETRRATAGRLALESKSALEKFPQRSLLLALEAVRTTESAGEPALPEAEEALRFAVESAPGISLDGFKSIVTFTQFVSDTKTGDWLVAASTFPETDVRIWNMKKLLHDPAYEPFRISVPADSTDERAVNATISPHSSWLVTNATDGYSLWRIADADEDRTPVSVQGQLTFIDPNDDTLILEQQAEQVILWRVDPESLEKQEVGRLTGQYSGSSPQKNWVRIQTAERTRLWPIAGSAMDRSAVKFQGNVIFPDTKNDRLVVEQQAQQAILWEVDLATLQKKEIKRFAGEYATSSPDFKYMVIKDPNKDLVLWETKSFSNPIRIPMPNDVSDVVIDPHNRWIIVFEALRHPDILVTPVDMFGNTQETEPWVSTTLSIFPLNQLDLPPFKFELDERGVPGQFNVQGGTMLLTADMMPNEYGNEQSKLGIIKLTTGKAPVVQISSQANYYHVPKFINEHWLIDLPAAEFFDLRDDDMEPDITFDSSLDFGYNGDNGELFNLVFAENGKYLVAGRERIDLEALDETRTLVREPNPDANPSQTDITHLLNFYPLTLGVEGEVTASTTGADGNWLVAGAEDGTLRLWNYKRPWASSLQLDRLSDHAYIALSNDNQWLALGKTLWRLEAGKPTTAYKLETQNGDMEAGVFSPDSHWFVHLQGVPERDQFQVRMSLVDMTRDLSKSSLQSDLIGLPGKIYSSVQFSPNSQWVIIGGSDTGMFNGQTGPFVLKLEDQSSYPLPPYMDAVFTTDQNHIILIPPSIYNEADGTTTFPSPEIWSLPESPSGSVEKIGTLDSPGFPIISRNGRWLLTVSGNGSNIPGSDSTLGQDSKLWDVNCVIEGYPCQPFLLTTARASFSPDSRYLMLGWKEVDDYDQPLNYEIWDMQPWDQGQKNQPTKVFAGRNPEFDPSLGNAGNIVVLQKQESCNFGERPAYTAVLSSTWSKHPWLANLSTFDGYAYLELGAGGGGAGGEPGYHIDYRVDTLLRNGAGYQSIVLRGHESSITASQVSPNERYVMTFSGGTGTGCSEQREKLLRLWDMKKMQADPLTKPVILPLKYDSETAIKYLAFSPDSNWIYVIDNKNVFYYFPTSIETLKEKACQVAGRNFIINEWERFFPGEDYRKTCDNLPKHPSVNLETTPGP